MSTIEIHRIRYHINIFYISPKDSTFYNIVLKYKLTTNAISIQRKIIKVQTIKLNIYVKANSKKGPLIDVLIDGSLVVYIREVAIDGQANKALIKLLSKHYNTPQSNIEIVRGHTSRHKIAKLVL